MWYRVVAYRQYYSLYLDLEVEQAKLGVVVRRLEECYSPMIL